MRDVRILTWVFVGALSIVVAVGCAGSCHPAEIVLNDFERDEDLNGIRWECHVAYERSSQRAGRGDYSLRVDLPVSRYPGVELWDIAGDWRTYDRLTFWVHVEGDRSLQVMLRIDDWGYSDDYGQRTNINLVLQPGANRLDIPMQEIQENPSKRLLNLRQIRRIMLFLIASERREVLYLDDFRLVRET